MALVKEIESALKPQNSEVVGQEDDLLVDSVLELANTDFTQQNDYEDVTPGSIRKHVEADMRIAYPGKPTSRKRIFSKGFQEDRSENQAILEGDDSDKNDGFTSDEEDTSISNKIDIHFLQSDFDEDDNDEDMSEDGDEDDNDEDMNEDGDEDDNDEDMSEDGDESSDFGGSITGLEKYSKHSEVEVKKEDDDPGIDIFSAKARDLKQDIKKGKSIRNQLTIWEKLIECRIKLQPALINTNKLFQYDTIKEFKSQLNSEEEEIVSETYSVLSNLMKGLLELQDVTLNASPEYKETKELKRKNNDTTNDVPQEKKKKSVDFLQEIHDDFKPFKDAVIQKWNEKTRLSYGRIRKSDFSAFDQPTLKQIEEILLDRERLLKRTQTKRSEYQILGKTSLSSDESPNENSSKTKDLQEYDPEIFDDDDFYHKLLRDFIENKTSDASDFSNRGKQWLELQKLRSRMKAKVDTRASKGRKIRFTVHNKMVNFMAPIPSYSWNDEAKNELFKSLFGQTLKQKG